MPSGIPAGSLLEGPMRAALAAHAGLPLAYQPVIEDGTYDQIKACIFRVLSYRVCEVALEDVRLECYDNHIGCEICPRKWCYVQTPALQCVTTAQVRLLTSSESINIKSFLEYLADKYGFRYSRMQVNRKAHALMDTRMDEQHVYLDSSVEVEAEIVWPYWT